MLIYYFRFRKTERCSVLPISIAGKINSVKMNTLPKFMYLFQCIPIFLPNPFFRE